MCWKSRAFDVKNVFVHLYAERRELGGLSTQGWEYATWEWELHVRRTALGRWASTALEFYNIQTLKNRRVPSEPSFLRLGRYHVRHRLTKNDAHVDIHDDTYTTDLHGMGATSRRHTLGPNQWWTLQTLATIRDSVCAPAIVSCESRRTQYGQGA
jgi:hypothetical protein